QAAVRQRLSSTAMRLGPRWQDGAAAVSVESAPALQMTGRRQLTGPPPRPRPPQAAPECEHPVRCQKSVMACDLGGRVRWGRVRRPASDRPEALVVWSFVYLALRRLAELILLR